jgi:hypothetical protein
LVPVWNSIDKAALEKHQAVAAKDKNQYDQDHAAYQASEDLDWQKKEVVTWSSWQQLMMNRRKKACVSK